MTHLPYLSTLRPRIIILSGIGFLAALYGGMRIAAMYEDEAIKQGVLQIQASALADDRRWRESEKARDAQEAKEEAEHQAELKRIRAQGEKEAQANASFIRRLEALKK